MRLLNPMVKGRSWIRWFAPAARWSFLLLAAGIVQCPAISYRVEGTLEHTTCNYDGPYESYVETFSIVVDGCKWFAHVNSAFAKTNGVVFWETGYDGTNLFVLTHSDPAIVPYLQRPVQTKGPVILDLGSIKPGPMPPPDYQNLTSLLWLTYASGCVLGSQTTPRLRAVWMMEYQGLWETGVDYAAQWKIHPSSGGLPEQVVYFNEGLGRFFKDGQHQTFKPPPPYDDGFTNALFTASFTNLGAINLPSEARFIYYGADLRAKQTTKKLAVFGVDVIIATNFVTAPETRPLLPDLPATAFVSDDRLRNRDQLFRPGTVITNRNWHLGFQKDIEAQYRTFREQQAARSGVKTPQHLAKVFFGIGAVSIAVFFAWQARNSRVRNINERLSNNA